MPWPFHVWPVDALARWGDMGGSSAWVRLRLLALTHGAHFPILCDVPLHTVHDREVTLVSTLCTTKKKFISTNIYENILVEHVLIPRGVPTLSPRSLLLQSVKASGQIRRLGSGRYKSYSAGLRLHR